MCHYLCRFQTEPNRAKQGGLVRRFASQPLSSVGRLPDGLGLKQAVTVGGWAGGLLRCAVRFLASLGGVSGGGGGGGGPPGLLRCAVRRAERGGRNHSRDLYQSSSGRTTNRASSRSNAQVGGSADSRAGAAVARQSTSIPSFEESRPEPYCAYSVGLHGRPVRTPPRKKPKPKTHSQ